MLNSSSGTLDEYSEAALDSVDGLKGNDVSHMRAAHASLA
jgi:hypothetical protein